MHTSPRFLGRSHLHQRNLAISFDTVTLSSRSSCNGRLCDCLLRVRLPRPTFSIHHPSRTWIYYAISGDAVPFTQSDTGSEASTTSHPCRRRRNRDSLAHRTAHPRDRSISLASVSAKRAVLCIRVGRGSPGPVARRAAQLWLMHQIWGQMALR
jgi:hypothetical protein